MPEQAYMRSAYQQAGTVHGSCVAHLSRYEPNFKVVQLTSLRPTTDAFCTILQDALKIDLKRVRRRLCQDVLFRGSHIYLV